MEQIVIFDGGVHYYRDESLKTYEANALAVKEANKWLREHQGVELTFRASLTSADFLVIVFHYVTYITGD